MDAFEPATLGPLRLRNRLLKAATYEGMSPGGVASDALVEHHVRLARGGVGMTTVAYCAVAPSGRTFGDQLQLGPASEDKLRQLVQRVHDEGAAVSLQLGHAGFFSKLRDERGRAPRGPSRTLNAYGASSGVPIAGEMNEADIRAVPLTRDEPTHRPLGRLRRATPRAPARSRSIHRARRARG